MEQTSLCSKIVPRSIYPVLANWFLKTEHLSFGRENACQRQTVFDYPSLILRDATIFIETFMNQPTDFIISVFIRFPYQLLDLTLRFLSGDSPNKVPTKTFGRKRNSVLSVHRTSSTATNSARSFSDSSTSLALFRPTSWKANGWNRWLLKQKSTK